ncbi:DUF6916 family protein [Intrasporangium calvum]|uniref:DUF6916 domain-containing protein n=1 Tax=Intrasporangium calvum (strain ATCC 23552 / DSM 43043 / JCM 3097 / NBRC 12989 / NCIMB 10167 / NRRL B-3866 / 7 KIP) TaxID=710696 RepID=E6SD12_INTC7|nr:hypothetical protein [Intrasporangium calvum]ADU48600.1 hypothetical protein Intca_2090 [Intrasporangium calvum DSM 43043]AXG13608.1 hypothetical protein DN585_09520 [Intrasporangium calvum]
MLSLSRRQILRSGAVGAVSLAVLAEAAPASAAPAASAPGAAKGGKSLLTRSRFAKELGATFTMRSPVSTWKARLEEVGDLVPLLRVGDESRFSLTFSTTEPGPPQGAFDFSRPGFEATSLFVIADRDRRRYVAIVNRL